MPRERGGGTRGSRSRGSGSWEGATLLVILGAMVVAVEGASCFVEVGEVVVAAVAALTLSAVLGGAMVAFPYREASAQFSLSGNRVTWPRNLLTLIRDLIYLDSGSHSTWDQLLRGLVVASRRPSEVCELGYVPADQNGE